MKPARRGAWSWVLVLLVPVCVGGLSAVMSGRRSTRRQAATAPQPVVPLSVAPHALIAYVDSGAQWILGSARAPVVVRVISRSVCASCESTLLGVEDVTALFGGSVQARLLLVESDADTLAGTQRRRATHRILEGSWRPSLRDARLVPSMASLPWGSASSRLGAGAIVMIDGDMLPSEAPPRFMLERLRVHLLAMQASDTTRPIRTFQFR